MSAPFLVSAMSGGVDSTVATALMLEAGYRVKGITLRLKDALTAGQCGGSPEEEERIRQVAATLGIEHEFLDYTDLFRDEILGYSWREYCAGRTPNPCAFCNRLIKFGRLMEYAQSIGAAGLITGHYADIQPEPTGEITLRPARDTGKNQVYFLALLRREQLAYARMPLAQWLKSEVREKARALGVQNAEAKESQDACFTFPGESFPSSLAQYFGTGLPAGEIVDSAGKVRGRHRGLHLYTIGQRKGLDVAMGVPAYVQNLDTEHNRIVLSTDLDQLAVREVRVSRWNALVDMPKEWRGRAQFRYRQQPLPGTLRKLSNEEALFVLDEGVTAPAAGQVAAFFDGDRLVAGAIIESNQ